MKFTKTFILNTYFQWAAIMIFGKLHRKNVLKYSVSILRKTLWQSLSQSHTTCTCTNLNKYIFVKVSLNYPEAILPWLLAGKNNSHLPPVITQTLMQRSMNWTQIGEHKQCKIRTVHKKLYVYKDIRALYSCWSTCTHD